MSLPDTCVVRPRLMGEQIKSNQIGRPDQTNNTRTLSERRIKQITPELSKREGQTNNT